jgi:hypothetical protein
MYRMTRRLFFMLVELNNKKEGKGRGGEGEREKR